MAGEEGVDSDSHYFESIPSHLQVQFWYYKGRYHLYNNQAYEERNNLKMSYNVYHQHKDIFDQENDEPCNLRHILRFLIPAEMLVGKFPKREFL